MEGIHLKQVTVRGVPVEVEKMIKREAESKGLSLNKAFLSLLGKATGAKEKSQRKKLMHHDLDHLCGVWTKRQAEEFIKAVAFQRTIDEDLWKKAKS